jgi:crotonyl-CoA carboxylase/reductase
VKKNLYEIGEIPPLGHVPERMYAATIRQERYGPPLKAFAIEEIEVPRPAPHQVLVHMMACGVNFNGVWTAMGRPVDVIAIRKKRGEPYDFHIGGSEGSGVVWAVGERVKGLKVGDPVSITSCHWDESGADIRMGADPITSNSASVWGYEDNFGGFAQFTVVDEYQCHPKPARLTWEEAACFYVSGATAYRQLMGWHPNVVRPGDPVLIWGGAGGLGSLAIQIAKLYGGVPIAVVSDPAKFDFCKRLGAHGVINRNEFTHWGRLPSFDDTAAYARWLDGARAFGKKFWEVLGEKRQPRIVFEHSGQATLPTSVFLCDNAGMVVICGGTSGYNGDIDLRFLWMRSKRLQGSHFASVAQCAHVTRLIADGRLDPCLSLCAPLPEIGALHQLIADNRHPPGNLAVLVNAPGKGLRTLPS